MYPFIALITAWLLGSRLVGSIVLYQLAWGKAWPAGSPSIGIWIRRGLVCPEYAFWKYSNDERGVAPIPVGNYCGKR